MIKGMTELGGTKETRPLMRAGFLLLGLGIVLAIISVSFGMTGGSPFLSLMALVGIVLIVVGRLRPPVKR